MHCDFEALMHVYKDTPYLDQIDGLARFLGSETSLYAEGYGGSAFDESQSDVWYQPKENYSDSSPIPLAGCGVTIEYRCESDVSLFFLLVLVCECMSGSWVRRLRLEMLLLRLFRRLTGP